MNLRTMLGVCSFCAVWWITDAQVGARNSIPETVMNCYQNSTAYNRYTRHPMHVDNLIAIIRKIERKEPQMDMRRIARILINRYMFDGIEFDPAARNDLVYNPTSQESIKTQMIKSYIPSEQQEAFPQGVLDNDEFCSLHWMLSHSMNATVRDEERFGSYNPNTGSGSYGYNSGTGSGGSGSANGNGAGYNSNPGYGSGSGGQYGSGSGGQYGSGSGSQYGNHRGRRSVDGEEGERNETSHDDHVDKVEENVMDSSKDEEISAKDALDEHAPEFTGQSQDKDDEQEIPIENPISGSNDTDTDSDTPKLARQVSQRDPLKTRRPLETGVIYTKWGAVSAGRLIGGIAAGLQPMTIPVGSGSPYPSTGYYGSGSNNNGPGQGGYSGFGDSSYGNGAGSYGSGSGSGSYGSGGSPFSQGGSSGQMQRPYGRKKRQIPSITFQPIQNIHAATLAGDVGQAAVRNGKFPQSNVSPPRGTWNDTICPREFIWDPYPYADKEIWMESATFTYLTEAEVRGGMDGLILGTNIQRWDNAGIKLSELLAMYYSENGIAGEPQYRACNRGSLFNGAVDQNSIHEQAKSFAYMYNNASQVFPHQTIIDNPSSFLNPVSEAYSAMSGLASTIGSGDGVCKRQSVASSVVDMDDNLKFTELKNRFYAVLDHTATFDEINQQKRFMAQFVHEIMISPHGARLGVVDGNTGQILINPNTTDNGAILACQILSLPSHTKTQDINRVLDNLRGEINKLREEEMRLNYDSPLGIVVLIMVQGRKLDEGQRDAIRNKLVEFDHDFGDVEFIFASSKYQQGDFDGYLVDAGRQFVRIQSVQNISDYADEFAKELTHRIHGRLAYTKCNVNRHSQENEHKVTQTVFVTPATIQYYRISADFFYSAKDLRLRFTSDNGKVRICHSRQEQFPNSRNNGVNGVTCHETRGSYVAPGTAEVDVEFAHKKPCGKHGNRRDCGPVYLSITPTQYPASGQAGLDCRVEGCESSNQVKVTFTHWDMRCNGAFKSNISLSLMSLLLLISISLLKRNT